MTDSSNVRAPPPSPGSDAARLMQYDASKKSTGIAYLLWFFLGALGVHRFYLGQTGSGVAMAIISVISWVTVFIGVGLLGIAVIAIWWIVDAFLIPGIATRANQELATRLSRL
ncbi:MAG: TM2 domain-containing protein [Enhydrobacter sp.]|nr:MAG: TM2 domain-containing protein [Enhydrobacter sp.]